MGAGASAPHWIWRVVLGVFGLAGAALAGVSLPNAIREWSGPTAIAWGTPASFWYTVIFWLEVVVMIVLSIWATRRGRKDLIAPLVLAIVGIHFIPLGWVFMQPVFVLTGVLVTAVAVVAALVPIAPAARSFWCGVLAAPILLVVGGICLVLGLG